MAESLEYQCAKVVAKVIVGSRNLHDVELKCFEGGLTGTHHTGLCGQSRKGKPG